ncbi:MAG: hypothetical protein AB8B55_23205 [Mariniblastus sp.]
MKKALMVSTLVMLSLNLLFSSLCRGQEVDGSVKPKLEPKLDEVAQSKEATAADLSSSRFLQSRPTNMIGFRFLCPGQEDKPLHPWLTRMCENGEVVFAGGAYYSVRTSKDFGSPIKTGVLSQALFTTKLPVGAKKNRITKVECKLLCHCAIDLAIIRIHTLNNGTYLIQAAPEKIRELPEVDQEKLRFIGGHEIKKPGFYLLNTDGFKSVEFPRAFLVDWKLRIFETPGQESLMAVSSNHKGGEWFVSLAEFSAKVGELGSVVRLPIQAGGQPSVTYADRDNLIVIDRIGKDGRSVKRIRNIGRGWEVQLAETSTIHSIQPKHDSIIPVSDSEGTLLNGGYDQPHITELNFKSGEVMREFDIELEANAKIYIGCNGINGWGCQWGFAGWNLGGVGYGPAFKSDTHEDRKLFFVTGVNDSGKKSLLEVSLKDQKQVALDTRQWTEFRNGVDGSSYYRPLVKGVTWLSPFSIEQ